MTVKRSLHALKKTDAFWSVINLAQKTFTDNNIYFEAQHRLKQKGLIITLISPIPKFRQQFPAIVPVILSPKMSTTTCTRHCMRHSS